MHIVRIDAGAQDGFECRKSIPSFGPPGLVRSQVARNNVWERSRPRKWTEVVTPSQVRLWIDFCGLLAKVGITARGKFRWWSGRVATIAVSHCVNNVAAQSHQAPVFPYQIQRDRCDLEPSLNP